MMEERKNRYLRLKNDILNSINLNEEWKTANKCNCYGYAMGFDKSESDIFYFAYQLGRIGFELSHLKDPSSNRFEKYFNKSFQELFELDLDTLGIEYKSVSEDFESLCDIDSDGYLSWVVALYEAKSTITSDFHLLRKTSDGIWYHKRGTTGAVTNIDDDKKIITNLDDIYLDWMYDEDPYVRVGVYNLRLKR